MSSNTEHVLKEALALPLQERAELVERLLATFQEPVDPEIDKAWLREAEDRLSAYDRGELKAVEADELMNKLRQRRLK